MTEARLAHHGTTWWLWGGLVSWVALVRLQEPARFRRGSEWFFWPSVEVAAFVLIGLVPLLWALVRREGGNTWSLRLARRPIETVVSIWMGVAGYGVVLSATTVLAIFAVDRMLGVRGATSVLVVLMAELSLLACCVAGLAPVLAVLRMSVSRQATLWGLLLLVSAWIGFPLPLSSLLILQEADPTMAPSRAYLPPGAVWAGVLATTGGLLLSIAFIHRHLRH